MTSTTMITSSEADEMGASVAPGKKHHSGVSPTFFRNALFPGLALHSRQHDDRRLMSLEIDIQTLSSHTEESIRSFWNVMCAAIACPTCALRSFAVRFDVVGT